MIVEVSDSADSVPFMLTEFMMQRTNSVNTSCNGISFLW